MAGASDAASAFGGIAGAASFANPVLGAGLSLASGAISGLTAPGIQKSAADSFASQASPFIVGGSAIASADPISRSLNNLAPVLIAVGVVWLLLKK